MYSVGEKSTVMYLVFLSFIRSVRVSKVSFVNHYISEELTTELDDDVKLFI